jgi:plastocyanin
MFKSPAEIAGWVIGILIVGAMGLIVALGPFHKVNKVVAVSHYSPLHVKLVTDPKIVADYVPVTITAHVGQQITWTNLSDATHTVTSRDNKTFDSKDLPVGHSWTYAPTKVGTFPYYCIYHPLMHGVLVVRS